MLVGLLLLLSGSLLLAGCDALIQPDTQNYIYLYIYFFFLADAINQLLNYQRENSEYNVKNMFLF